MIAVMYHKHYEENRDIGLQMKLIKERHSDKSYAVHNKPFTFWKIEINIADMTQESLSSWQLWENVLC